MVKAMSATQVMQHFQTTKCFDKVLDKLKVISMKDGAAVAELKIEEKHTNIMGGFHGGLSATLVDLISGFALLTEKTSEVPSVSVDLHLTYCKGAKLGDEIVIKANTKKTGKTLAFLEVLIQDKTTGDILVKGSHTKFLVRK